MIEHDFDEEFVPIAAELQRLPYLSPSRDFADHVIAGIDRLQPARGVAPVLASRHLELHQGGQQAVIPRRRMGVMRATGRATAGVALIAAAAFMFFEVDVLTAILAAASSEGDVGPADVIAGFSSTGPTPISLQKRSPRVESRAAR